MVHLPIVLGIVRQEMRCNLGKRLHYVLHGAAGTPPTLLPPWLRFYRLMAAARRTLACGVAPAGKPGLPGSCLPTCSQAAASSFSSACSAALEARIDPCGLAMGAVPLKTLVSLTAQHSYAYNQQRSCSPSR